MLSRTTVLLIAVVLSFAVLSGCESELPPGAPPERTLHFPADRPGFVVVVGSVVGAGSVVVVVPVPADVSVVPVVPVSVESVGSVAVLVVSVVVLVPEEVVGVSVKTGLVTVTISVLPEPTS